MNATAPTEAMVATACEADELYQNAGEKSTPHRDPYDPRRQCVILPETGDQRLWGCDHANARTCAALIPENLHSGRTWLSTDAWQSDRGSHPCHATVRHGMREWARDDDGDGRREVHGNAFEGPGAALRTPLRTFRGVHQQYLPLDVATYEAIVKPNGAHLH